MLTLSMNFWLPFGVKGLQTCKAMVELYSTNVNGVQIDGKQLIRNALDDLLKPLPATPKARSFEITLEIETGNLIYRKFNDLEELIEFIKEDAHNPQWILEQITPKRNRKIGEQSSFYEAEEDEEDW